MGSSTGEAINMIMALTFTTSLKDSVVVGTGVTIGVDVKGKGELYNVDLTAGKWKWQPVIYPG